MLECRKQPACVPLHFIDTNGVWNDRDMSISFSGFSFVLYVSVDAKYEASAKYTKKEVGLILWNPSTCVDVA